MSARCIYCRHEIRWIQLPDESGELKYIPLDLKAAVYHQDEKGWQRSSAFVNHLSVCPSRKKQRRPEIQKKGSTEEKELPWWVTK